MSLVMNIFNKVFIKRYDEQDHLKYFRKEDYKNFKSNPFNFKYRNSKINGEFYYYENYKKDELIIFLHGIGGGRSAYLKEIEHICKLGYKVLAYDYLGCAESEGENIRSIHEPLSLLFEVLNYLQNNKEYENLKIDIIGHSWGAFTALNILNYFDNINTVIAISGFISAERIANSLLPKGLRFITKKLLKFEYEKNPNFAGSTAIEALEKTNTKVLIIHDENDKLVKYKDHAKYLEDNIKNKKIKYFITKNRMHNPYYTEDAVKYMNETFSNYNKLVRSKKIKTKEDKINFKDSIDWNKLTKHSEDVLIQIALFLKG